MKVYFTSFLLLFIWNSFVTAKTEIHGEKISALDADTLTSGDFVTPDIIISMPRFEDSKTFIVAQDRSQRAQEHLDSLFDKLHSYKVGMLFLFEKFDIEALVLGSTISNIANFIQVPEPQNTEQLVQIRFAQIVYSEMLTTNALHRAFHSKHHQAHTILKNLGQLNVCLFEMRQRNGNPGPSIRDYESLVSYAARKVNEWMSNYAQLGFVEPTIDPLVKMQLRKVQNTISELKRYFPQIE